jgi:predicted permease
MSLLSRIANLLRPARVNRELDEELASHLAEADARGRDPFEARRAFGSPLRRREESRDIRLIPWLDSLRADALFGWRQLMKRKVTSAAAVLSLALAIGACTAAFRIIDALLLRPLPVAHAARLYSVAFQSAGVDNINGEYDSCSYPMFLRMRAAASEQAELIAVSYAGLTDLTYASDQEIEKAYLQYVSGWTFTSFGLRPAAGRLFTADDDRDPGAHPYAVISDDYWSRRFARDPNIVGRTFRIGDTVFQIVGVAEAPFTGTETGTVTDVFLPMAMKNPRTLASPNNYWLRTLVQLREGVDPRRVHEILRATFAAMQEEKAKTLTDTQRRRDPTFKEKILFEPAAAGRSNLQRDYRRSLTALGILVFLALLIACANVANLMTAQAAARAREMALRISIGAGRARLVQLVLIESAWLAFLATAIGGMFAWWAAPLVLRVVDSPENPARLALPADWRVLAFALVLALGVTCVFGLAPALRASAMKPAIALRGGEDAHSRHRIMYALVALQIAFCFVVHFVAGLFVASFDRLSSQPTGFSSERILNLESSSRRPQPLVLWQQGADRLRAVPGVEKVALTIWPTMSGESDVGEISVNGAPTSEVNSDILHVSPGWFDAMRIPILAGNDLPASGATPDAAVVNESFVKQYFNGASPVGQWFVISRGPGATARAPGATARFQVAGVVRDARSRDNMRRPIRPTAYIPFALASDGSFQPTARGTFVVRTAGANPLAIASILRQEVPRARPEIRVGNIRTQTQIIESHTVREHLLSMLALFFAGVALLLAAIGLYGVLDYSVLQRRREIGVRMAIGAPAAHIARGVATGIFGMVFVGGIAGIALGMAAARYVATLLFEVNAASPAMIALPALTIFAAALLSALPAVVRAVRIDPAQCLRSE